MSEGATSTKQEMAVEVVQEIAKRGDEVPQKYILKDGFPEAIEAPPELWTQKLLIDLSLLSSSTPDALAELAKLRSALAEWGCFQAINHGVETSFLEELIEHGKQFFELPLEEKLKCSLVNDKVEGYGSDLALAIWCDRLSITVYPEETRILEAWPHQPQKLRELLDKFSKKLVRIKEDIYRAMARSLNVDENCFLQHQGGHEGPILVRLNLYPRCPCPQRVLGAKPHSDGTTMTLILPEQAVEGLQIQKDNIWYKVPVIPGALFVNMGDIGEVMSNGLFKSLVHRVITNSVKERVSVAAFFNPVDGIDLAPVSELINEQRPQLYKKFRFTFLDFRKMFHEAQSRGQTVLDTLRV